MTVYFRPVALLSLALLCLMGCGIKKTDAERWQQFCHIYQGAAYNIMFDRQNNIPKQKSVEQLNKMPDGLPRNMLLQLVDEAQLQPPQVQLADKKAAAAAFQAGKYERCLATPH